MKTKITFVLLVCAVLTSCSKLHYGHGSDGDDDEIVLTENNYVFEGDLAKFALGLEIDALKNEIETIEALAPNDPGYDEGKQRLPKAKTELAVNVTEQKNTFGFDDILDRVGRRVPRPRGPGPGIIPTTVSYIAFYAKVKAKITAINKQGEVVGQTEDIDLKSLNGTRGRIQILPFDFFNATPEQLITLRVRTENEKDEVADYDVILEVVSTEH